MKFNLTYFLVATVILVNSASAQRASFGGACSKVLRCDSKASLTCDNGTCQCVMPEKMIYDINKSKCVTIAGEKCVYTAVEMADDTSETETTRWREELDCISGASCTAGYCKCGAGHFEHVNGTCEEKHLYGENCQLNSHCKDDLHLVCNTNGTCDCNELSSYDLTKRKCVGRVGSLCKHYPECVINAACPPKQRREEQRFDIDSYHGFRARNIYIEVDYLTESCQCKDGYTRTGEGNCLVSYGASCDYHISSRRCLPGMICREGYCTCKYDSLQEYDVSTSRCQSLVGAPCSAAETGCGDHAECLVVVASNQLSNFTDEQSTHCHCKEGFIEVNRKCEIEYGHRCGPSIYENTKCDSIAPLKCTEGSCQCNLLEYYDLKIKLCRGLEGALCSTDINNEYFCTDGATCDSYRNKTQSLGQCTCNKENYVSTSTRSCLQTPEEKATGMESLVETTQAPAPTTTIFPSALHANANSNWIMASSSS